MTVLENVEAPLKACGVEGPERIKRATQMLDTVGLDGFENAYPKELSGGMKQRVGFARALVVEPEILFMDEPFSALDVLTAENLRNELLDLWEDQKMPTRTIFIVTHNIDEAVLLADRVVVLGKNPARIRTDFRVDLPRPRDHKNPRFSELVDYVYTVLTQPEAHPEVPSATPAKPHYPMLPHARPGGIAGLLEILADRNGREDIHLLADLLAFEVDDILPIVEAAAMLGFVTVSEGEVEMTAAGHEFLDADILRKKDLFRAAALERVPLLKKIVSALEAKTDRTLPDEFFEDLLDEHFSEDETKLQLETAINWGRYAEMFDHDSRGQRFFIPQEAVVGSAK